VFLPLYNGDIPRVSRRGGLIKISESEGRTMYHSKMLEK
jgi:hypothetical protein